MTEVYHATQLTLIPLSRTCKTCGIDKPLEENFHKQTVRGKLMYRTHCKECRSKEAKARPPRQEWIEVASKICLRCDPPTEKPIDEFCSDLRMKDRHSCYCRECMSKYHKQEPVKARRKEREEAQGEAFKRKNIDNKQAWREKNIEKLRIQWREKYASDPEYAARMRKNTRKWIEEHQDEMNAHQMRRKAVVQGATAERVDYQDILKQHGAWCYICDQPILPHQKLEFDHVIPLIPRPGEPQGTHTADNVRPTHKICNARKTNKRLEDMLPFDRRGP